VPAAVREACGLFGIAGVPDAALLTYYGLYALQHRGEESAGIVSSDGTGLVQHRGVGLVADVFDGPTLERLRNPTAIGHVRYSTTGSPGVQNAQPLVVVYAGGPVAVAHNGNLTNAVDLRRECEGQGSIFQTTCDSEVVLHLLARPGVADDDPLARALRRLEGAFSLLVLTPDALVAARDPQGFRPLALGRLGDAHCVASETCAFDLVGAEYVRDIEPGELCTLTPDGRVRSRSFVPPGAVRRAHCIFEHIYFARPDSRVFEGHVHAIRKNLGRQLAVEHPADADVVVPVPDSGNAAALGFAEASRIPLDHGFIRNHYVGRTFIRPEASDRANRVEIKLNPVAEVVRGRRVVVVDDSIVRGTTARSRVAQLRRAGAREIHLRITCPPHRFGCFYGIDFPAREHLIAAQRSVAEVADFLGVESLGYLSVEGMLEATGRAPSEFCTACFTGEYPLPVAAPLDKLAHERRGTVRPASGRAPAVSAPVAAGRHPRAAD
jgi:amidophosphoribosyltransferase